jgi:hypothetical protein
MKVLSAFRSVSAADVSWLAAMRTQQPVSLLLTQLDERLSFLKTK